MKKLLTISKAERTGMALYRAAYEAEQCYNWASAAEFYRAAALICRGTGAQVPYINDLLTKAAECSYKRYGCE
ncbi:hypothetical protein AO391_24455 [Pseudomonas marginalis ICMP 9505]|uniref:ANR family transcriptional regulator n=1 Tax=Pseudomonas kitaguniensis TaxID=2607908 RepID=A0A5N7JS89_9PSED|nr:hypothetical protein [Pseudomonas kitaguniensis]KTC14476.1 hypothetical protein AO391_24455 [Pseudomonas marginalis ICMP 9505]MPQ84249.1 hypothetical protein [Pseudomonas kitaguniensis]MPR00744.1 hypothetical protein [Pseudomonas kitaguniensis]